jgi:hypothetical protein
VEATFRDLPARRYPFTVRLLDAATRAVRWETEVAGPGALQVPGRDTINDGQPVIAQIIWPGGDVTEAAGPV